MPLKPQEKLRWMGLKDDAQRQSVIEKEIAIARQNFDNFSDFRDMVNDQFDFDGFETQLRGEGFSNDEAETFTRKIQDNFNDQNQDGSVYDEFKTHTDNSDGWAGFKSAFSQNPSFSSRVQNENGGAAAGVEVHDTRGTTRDGVAVPPGTIEVFGVQVHFSGTGNTRSGTGTGTPGSGGGGNGTQLITIENLDTQSGDDTFSVGEGVTLEAEVTNNSDYEEDAAITLYQSGNKVQTQVLGSLGASDSESEPKLEAGETRTITFNVQVNEYVCHDYRVNTSDPLTVCWKPDGVD